MNTSENSKILGQSVYKEGKIKLVYSTLQFQIKIKVATKFILQINLK